jgi:pilus assembly protein CpaC
MKSLSEQTEAVRFGNWGKVQSLACGIVLALILWPPLAGAQVLPEQINVAEDNPPAKAPPPEPVPLPGPRQVVPPSQCTATITGFAPLLTTLPPKPLRSAAELASFVESLGTTDGTIEVVVGEGRLLTLKENLAVAGQAKPLIAVGDPTVVDPVVVGPRQLRLIGQRLGTTDLSITTSTNQVYTFQVQVVPDLHVLRCQLKAVFPDANLKLAMIKDHMVVEGEARDTGQVVRIIQTIRAYLISVQATQTRKISGQSAIPPAAVPSRPATPGPVAPAPAPSVVGPEPPAGPVPPGANVVPEAGQLSITGTVVEPSIINLIRVIGSQQVLLKVRVAELNRTAMREIGADILGVDPDTGAILGTQIGGAGIFATGTVNGSGITGQAVGTAGPSTTAFGIFQKGDFEVFLRALRRNLILKTLAEPNLVTLNGHQASFLAGGEYPVPVPQVGASGVAPTITVQFKEFGVRLGFTPYILDGDAIRLSVDPEVSEIDFTIGTTLVAGGSPVPGVRSRRAHTTVELHQGQTLMIAGLLQLTLDGQTSRIPGLGDLPILGPFFSNTTSSRMEKELVVMVTPYLVEPLNPDQVPPTPGDEVKEANDLELYFLGRFEGRTGKEVRSTVQYDDPFHLIHHVNLEKKYLSGPCGYSD